MRWKLRKKCFSRNSAP